MTEKELLNYRSMTDKEILEEVHRRLQGMASVNAQPIKDFIEQEWQKADEASANDDRSYDARVVS